MKPLVIPDNCVVTIEDGALIDDREARPVVWDMVREALARTKGKWLMLHISEVGQASHRLIVGHMDSDAGHCRLFRAMDAKPS